MNRILNKLIAILMITLLMSTNMILLVNESIASGGVYSSQDSKTNNANVEFNAYFKGKSHEANSDMSSEDLMLYIELNVKNAGYVKNSVIEFADSNFSINLEEGNKYIQKIDKENNKIELKQIDKGENVTLEIPLQFSHKDSITADYLNKEFKTKFTAEYIDSNGKSKSVEKTVLNSLTWTGDAELENSMKINKYIPFIQGEKYGVILQLLVNNKVKDNKFPVKTSKTTISIPELDGTKPTNVSVIANNTKATNGKENGIDFNNNNYLYDSENNLLSINVENSANDSNMVSWKNNSSDEFLVTILYEGKDLYNKVVEIQNNAKQENEEDSMIKDVIQGLNIKTSIKLENTLYTFDNKVISKDFDYTNELKEKVGEFTTTEISATNEISKGYIYASYNIEKDENKTETIYNINYVANVENINLVENVELKQQIDKFVAEDKTEGLTTLGNKNYTYNKEVKIEKSIFDKMLGEDGKIEVFDSSNNKIGEINKDTKLNEQNEYVIDISSFNKNQIIMKTSKPIIEGKIEINVTKAIAKNIDYSVAQMKNFKTIETSVIGNTLEASSAKTASINMIEPKSEATIEINKDQLSTVTKNNNVELRATLNTASVFNALYENPTISIELPEVIKDIEVNSIKALYNDELKIKDAKLVEENGKKSININMEGTQTEYSTENSDIPGTSIIIDTNMELDKLGTNQNAEIKMSYTNNSLEVKENKTAKTDIPIIAPTGVIATNEISNYKEGAEDILTISDETKEITVDTYSKARDVVFKGQVINNYENAISNAIVLGRFPVEGNKNVDTNADLQSNITFGLKSKISINGDYTSNIKVYYSANADATNDISVSSNGWTLEPENLAEMKSYLIVVENTTIEAGKQFDFSYTASMPENLEHNKSTSTMYKVFYNNVSEIGTMAETKVSPIIKLTTGVGPELEVTLSSSLPEGAELKNKQYIRFYVTVKNNGDIDGKNVKIKVPIPTDMILTNYEELNNIYNDKDVSVRTYTINLGDIKSGVTVEKSYELKINRNDTDEALPTEKEVTNYVELNADNISGTIKSNEYKFKIDMGENIPLTVINGTNTMESQIYSVGSMIKYTLNMTSSSAETINNVIATIPLPEGVEDVDAYIKSSNGNVTNGVEISDDKVIVKVGSIEAAEFKQIVVTFKIGKTSPEKFSTLVSVTSNELGLQYSNERWIYTGKSEMSGRQIEPSKEYIKENEEFTYKFEINTTGTADISNFVLEDELPSELTLIESSFEIKSSNGEDIDYGTYSNTTDSDGKIYLNIQALPAKAVVTITLKVSGRLEFESDDGKELVNKAYISAEGIDRKELNSTTVYLEYNPKLHDNATTPSQGEKHKISGVAWLDSNRNGMRDEGEQTISGVQAMLLYRANGQIVQDANSGENKIVTTGDNGQYEFTNLQANEYLVVFIYDTGLYSITTYQKDGVDTNRNSDAIETNITYNGVKQIAGITNTIQITNNNVRNIDLGLYQDEKFDLSLQKYVTKIALTTPTIGTAQYEYGDSTLEKIEILGQNAGKSNIVIEYKIVIKNEGGVAGYAKKVVDYLPEDVGFSTDLNKDWYLSETNGNIYNASLANTLIQPGETKELKLIVTKKITEESIGTTLKNQAEIYESYNEQGLKDIDSTEANRQDGEDDLGQADIILSLVTGKIIMYTGLIILVLAIITIGVIAIKKKVLEKNK